MSNIIEQQPIRYAQDISDYTVYGLVKDKEANKLDLRYADEVTGITVTTIRADTSTLLNSCDVRFVFNTGTGWFRLESDGTADSDIEQTLTIYSVLDEGNTISELSALTDVPAFENSELQYAIAMKAANIQNVNPRVKFGVECKTNTQQLVLEVLSPEYSYDSNIIITDITADSYIEGGGSLVIEGRYYRETESVSGYTDWMSLPSMTGVTASKLQYRVTASVADLTQSLAQLNSIKAEYNEGSIIAASSGVSSIITKTEDWRVNLKGSRVLVRHSAPGMSTIKSYVTFRDKVNKVSGELIGTGNGQRTNYVLNHTNGIKLDTVKLYYDGVGVAEGYDVNCEKVWDSFTVGNPDVIVAVLDGGIQLDHPDLEWNCLASGHQSYVSGVSEIVGHGHGTHVAGTIAAVTNNRLGVSGIAGGDYTRGRRGVSLLSLQCFYDYKDSNGETRTRSGNFETAMKDAADKGAVISQNSWGYDADADGDGKLSDSEIERMKNIFDNIGHYSIAAAMDYFTKYAGCDKEGNQLPDSPMKGGLVVFAAGNDNIFYGPPANYPTCVAVGAMNLRGEKASFSNFGDWVDICAPGTSIASTYPTNAYAKLSGTSMACPHVSGVAALITSYFGGQGFTSEDLRKRLLEGARTISASEGDTPIGPLVDAYGSFMAGDSEVPPVVDAFALTPQGHNVKLDFTGNGAYGYLVLAAPSRKAIVECNLADPSGKGLVSGTIVVADPALRNNPQEFILSGLEPDSDYYVAIASYSYNKRFSELSALKTVHTNANAAPVVRTDYNGKFVFRNWQEVDIVYSITDADEDVLTVDFQTDGRATFTQDEEGLWHFKINCQLVRAPAAFSASLLVTDEFGGRYSEKISYSILENSAPVLSVEPPGILLEKAGAGRVIDLDSLFSDEDGETLDYRLSGVQTSVINAELSEGHILTISAVKSELALTEVRVTAYDNMGASARADIQEISMPPTRMLPDCASQRRAARRAQVDFPLPLGPTIDVIVFCSHENEASR